MKKQNSLRLIAIFIAALIISMPFYISDVYAQSLTIVKNSGQANVQDPNKEGFIKTADDVWTLIVNAIIPGQTVSASQVKVNGFTFNSCTPSVNGYDCTYRFDYRGAQSLVETVYAVNVNLYDNTNTLIASNISQVTADGSPPAIANLSVHQGASQIANVVMDIADNPAACAGLGWIEVYDDESNTLVKNLTGQELQNLITSRCSSNHLTFTTTFPPSGNQSKTAKVIAYDRLGHHSIASDEFTYDYSGPSINTQSLRIGDFGNYIPSGTHVVDVFLEVTENGDYLTAEADSSNWNWIDEEAVCTKTNYTSNIFTCVWQNKNIPLSTSAVLTVTVSDGANTDTATVSKTFFTDGNAPVLDFFGAGFYKGTSYIPETGADIKVVFTEAESGINTGDIRADLSEIHNYQSVSEIADRCEQQAGQWTCFWENIGTSTTPAHSGTIYLVDASDKVGNQVNLNVPEAIASLVIDNVPPEIAEPNDIIVTALGTTDPVQFYQSHDYLQVDFYVNESHGVTGEVDFSDVVNDLTAFPNDDGITPATCTETSDSYWECRATTPVGIKAGYDSDAEIKAIAYDYAGNKAEQVKQIEILGTDSDLTDPDFWTVTSVTRTPAEGIDIHTAPYIAQRVFYRISLSQSTATLLGMNLDTCTGDTNKLNNYYMVNNMYGSTSPYIVLETNPQSFEQALHVNCTINIFSRSGNDVISVPEKETIAMTIPFYETKFESEQTRLDRKIKDERNKAEYGIYGSIALLNEIVKWLKVGCNVLSLWFIVKFWLDVLSIALDGFKKFPQTAPSAIALCYGVGELKAETGETLEEGLEYLCKILSCEHNLAQSFFGGDDFCDSFFGLGDKVAGKFHTYEYDAQNKVYNKKEISYAQAKQNARLKTDPYDNIYMAICKLCVPAIIHNLNKLTQIQCRYVGCLENEAKEGVTTIEGCRQLRDYQVCKYFLGDLLAILPGLDLLNNLVGRLQTLLKDPVGLLGYAFAILCKGGCGSEGTEVICSIFAWGLAIVDHANDIVGIYYSTAPAMNADYCAQIGVNAWKV